MRREVTAIVITAVLLGSLVVFANPATAIDPTVHGEDQVSVGETVTYTLAVDTTDATVEGLTLQFITTKTGESVDVTVTADGTITEFDPSEGVVGNHGIKVDELRRTLRVTPVDQDGETGYGYGYGDSQSTLVFHITFNGDAFVPGGEYALQASVHLDDGRSVESNEKRFEVTEDSEDS